ncbi:MAG: hypothetical protein ACYS21_18255 [Planctomycetota bacterium]
MVAEVTSRFGGWPTGPVFAIPVLGFLLAVAGLVFSLVMLIDCLKRKPTDFLNPITKGGEYDKLIWAVGIFLSLWAFFVVAIAYYFVVKRAKPEESTAEVEDSE